MASFSEDFGGVEYGKYVGDWRGRGKLVGAAGLRGRSKNMIWMSTNPN
jgi:hypothetical protein